MSITVKRTSLLDFASALYLGLSHPSRNVQAWEQLTTGKPAALATPPGAIEVSQQLAVLQGCQSATLATSTLHLYWDFFGTFAGRPMTIYADAETYPIALWGVERARARGANVETFAHQDVNDLRRLLKQRARSGSVQMVVADGFCPDCGRVAPIGEYVATAVSFGGSVVVDDTQALGIWALEETDLTATVAAESFAGTAWLVRTWWASARWQKVLGFRLRHSSGALKEFEGLRK